MDDSMDRSLDKFHVKPEFDTPEEDDQTDTSILQQSYVTVLKEEDIWSRMDNEIQSVMDKLSISKAEATLLLSYFHWDVSKSVNEWFDGGTSVRESVGILERPNVSSSEDEEEVINDSSEDEEEVINDSSKDEEEFFCGRCNKLHKLENSASISCGHRVCTNCWTSHIKNIFNETPEWNVWLKCPYVPCQASVDRDMIEIYASEEDKTKYNRYLLTSFAKETKTMKLCPRAASGRSCATDLSPGDSGNSGVYCICLLKFCFNCIKAVHSPVDCEQAAKWLAMISSGYQNPNRPLANTVPCPKCKRRIEANQYMIAEAFSLKMKCLPCNYSFCWLCRRDLSEHEEETCNNDAVPCEETYQQWRMEGFSADRFKDCYQNWNDNDLLMQKAKAKLQHLRTVDIPKLSKIQLPTVEQLEFVTEAGLQIIESIRILKWTYAYQYSLLEDKHDRLMKIWQDHVKDLMKELSDCIESNLPSFLEAEGLSENFNDFRIKLTELTSKTRKYNETLIRDLEDGLANDVSASDMSQMTYKSDQASGSGLDHDD